MNSIESARKTTWIIVIGVATTAAFVGTAVSNHNGHGLDGHGRTGTPRLEPDAEHESAEPSQMDNPQQREE
jgi:hypothetical protein